jgi:dihydroorotate dehydrogenase (fumarate)
MRIGPRDYLTLIEEAKDAVSIPIIASLNCISSKWWMDFALQIVNAGADALEVNAAVMPVDPAHRSEDIEKIYYDIIETLRNHLTAPFAVKIGPFFTSMARVAHELAVRGADALVLFNRFYHVDINIDTLEIAPGYRYSSPEEMYMPLRWIAILAGRVDCDLAASTGVHDAPGAVKQLLAGATAVQLCSTLYVNGPKQITKVVRGIEEWMGNHGFSSIDDLRGRLSQKQSANQEAYERLQYIKVFVGID